MITFEKYRANGSLISSIELAEDAPAVRLVAECQEMLDEDRSAAYGLVRHEDTKIRLTPREDAK
ncbi:hypothetical protein PLUTO_00360 [Luteibacter phage vB_LflM-Pluto]|uniref:Uncharacterized protein n=1 Tax=Luteibacter phage vB_LflM-Pluto TaxID=2948611 RepID=A0A9E7MUH9_9CAUD|nr:hypothetical protein PLUTO_00360 [Luteibacter phage vB_LflM-Pluto]